jgi:hypothetical protein
MRDQLNVRMGRAMRNRVRGAVGWLKAHIDPSYSTDRFVGEAVEQKIETIEKKHGIKVAPTGARLTPGTPWTRKV